MPLLDFKGKSVVYSHHLEVPFRMFKIDEKKSSTLSPDLKNKPNKQCKSDKLGKTDRERNTVSTSKPSLDDNLIIHGDNLHALKALLPRYSGKIKCIYIDPPYNTGNEGWKYNDKVNSPLIQEWLKQIGIGVDDQERHDKWLCMMWPRLQLLKELLADDGVICISCDDTEIGNLICILNEIFGIDNKEEIIAWRRRHNQPNDKSKPIAKTAEFIVIYAKNLELLKKKKSFNGLPLTGNFINSDKDPKGPWASKPWKAGRNQTGNRYKITTPTGKVYDEEWLGTKNTFDSLLKDKRIIFPSHGKGLPRKKYYQSERKSEGQVAHNFWSHKKFGSNQNASKEIYEMGIAFDNPKPSQLIKSILLIFSNKDSIILDSFAGSGTTAHAVLALNKEDGGHRKFILVECEDYASDITAERVRRVIKGVPKAKDENLKRGFGGSFTYCSLGEKINTENMLRGKLPDYTQLAEYIFYTATGKSLNVIEKVNASWFIGETEKYNFHLVYKPDLKFLKSKESALHLDLAETIQTLNKESKKTSLVFASASYIPQKKLKQKYNIQFCQLPYTIHKIMETRP